MKFLPIATERLVLRPQEPSDVDAIHRLRNAPEVARYQDWELPVPRERTEQVIAALLTMEGPEDGKGWSLTVVDRAEPHRVVGDIYVGLKFGGRSAELGYNIDPSCWGRGFASEAARAVVRWLFLEGGLLRVDAQLHPDNVASARVLEGCGMTFEGRSPQSFWVGNECSDNAFYGMSRAGWESWCRRPRHHPEHVDLVPLAADNRGAVGALATHKSQERFVSPMAATFGDILAPAPSHGAPWYRVIVADDVVVGFVVVKQHREDPTHPYLWRLLVDRMHQRRGIGTAALALVEQHYANQGAQTMELSWNEGPGSPGAVFLKHGYNPNGEVVAGKARAVKRLDSGG